MARVALPCLLALLLLAAPARAADLVVARPGGLTAGERAEAGVTLEARLPLPGVVVVDAGADQAAALTALRADPDVAWAEPDRPRSIAGEPLGELEWALHNIGQSVWWERGTADADVNAPEAWTLSRGAGATVAVVDTGADAGHPDLAGRLAPGWDFVEDDDTPQDANGHGTHVSGTIAAAENGIGVVGLAPEARVMPLRVLDAAGEGSSSDVAAAFAYAAEHGARVVNASLGSTSPSLVERLAIRAHPETLFVVAAGNGGSDGAGDDVERDPEYPCAYDEPNVVCVSATDADDAVPGFANVGATSVDLFAPGTGIVSSQRLGGPSELDRFFHTGAGYEIMQGTSMAAPHVAGAAALAAALQPGWGAGALKAALLDGARRLPQLAGRAVTGARLDAAGTAALAAGRPAGPGDASAFAPGGAPVAATPTLSALRLRGRPVTCRQLVACRARTASVTFRLGARAPVRALLEHRVCGGGRCGWRTRVARTRTLRPGTVRWNAGPRLLGVRLRPGRWRLTVATSANRLQRRFTVRGG